MYVYKLDTGNSQPETPHHPSTPLPATTTTTKKSISRSLGSLFRRSKTYRENINYQHPCNSDKEDTKEMVQESSRISVPAIEGGRRSLPVIEDDRKSVLVIEEGRKTVSGTGEGRTPSSGMEVAGMVSGRRSAENRAEMVMINVGALAELLQVKVLVTDMPAFMQVHAFRCARKTFDSLEKFSPKQIAS